MPFDKHLGASGEKQLELARAVTKQYVPVRSAPPSYEVLDPPRQATLEAWVEALIPAEGAWPSAAERGVAQYIDNGAAGDGSLRRMLIDVLDSIERDAGGDDRRTAFADAGLDDRIEGLRAFERERPAEFAILLELTFEGYYRDRLVAHVVESETGFRVSGPLAGIPSEEFDESMVESVRSRPSHYVEVAE